MSNRMMRWFDGRHLPEELLRVVDECRHLAANMDESLEESC